MSARLAVAKEASRDAAEAADFCLSEKAQIRRRRIREHIA